MLHNLGFKMAYRRSSGTDIYGLRWCASCHACHLSRGVAHCCDWGFSFGFFFCSYLYFDGGGERHTRYIYAEREPYQARRAMGCAERELERDRHLDDLLPSHADASAHAGGAFHRAVRHVYKHRHHANRVCRAIFHHWHRPRHHSRKEGTDRICIWLCLEYFLR
jgi:hypothetical protein